MREFKRKLMFLALIVMLSLAGRAEGVDVVLKSGNIVSGELIRETNTTITLQLESSQIEISKLTIRTIDGRPPFETQKSSASTNSPIPKDILIPAGDFLMGVIKGKENPVHTIYLDAFRIDALEVTNAEYRAFIEATNHPIIGKNPNTMPTNNPLSVSHTKMPKPTANGVTNACQQKPNGKEPHEAHTVVYSLGGIVSTENAPIPVRANTASHYP
jgi:formylglycine-generating enzyme required for sulfatase activity